MGATRATVRGATTQQGRLRQGGSRVGRMLVERRRMLSWPLTLATVALGLTLLRDLAHQGPLDPAHALRWWMLGLVFLAVDLFGVRLRNGRGMDAIGLGEIPLVVGLLLVGPVELALIRVAATLPALLLLRRLPLRHLVNTLASTLLSTVVAIVVFRRLAGDVSGLGVHSWPVAFSATIIYACIGLVLIALVVLLEEGLRAALRRMRALAPLTLICAVTNTSLALLAVTSLRFFPQATALVVIPAGMLILAYGAYLSERQKLEGIQLLYEATRLFDEHDEIEPALLSLLTKSRSMFTADVAELTLLPGEPGGQAFRTTVGGTWSSSAMNPIEVRPVEDAVIAVADRRDGVLLTPGQHGETVDSFLRQRNLGEAMVTVLRGADRLVGMLLVGNRRAEGSGYGKGELELFRALAGHAGVQLEKGRLEHSLMRLSELQRRLEHQAFHDALTGLANRALFTERINHVRRGGRGRVAVLLIDLDDFKYVNDSLGHACGDALLRQVARRLQDCLRPGDLAARLGGDEFSVLLERVQDEREATRVADRIVAELRRPMLLEGWQMSVHASVGIVVSAIAEQRSEELLQHADVAMYYAKSIGKNRWQVFEPSMQTKVTRRHEMRADTELALQRGQLEVHYQPIVSIATGALTAVEALVRWNHPERGIISPADFIPLSEESGLIVRLGHHVLEQACRQAATWQQSGNLVPSVTVNLSPRQLQEHDVVERVKEVLADTGLEPERLVLEITESAVMEDVDTTVDKLRRLRNLGVRLAIDDFGTGHSSLATLRQLPIDILKIAKPFVDDLGGAEGDVFVRAIVALGKALRLDMVAEGIETEAQLRTLARLGCPRGQGYLFGKAVDAATLTIVLDRWQRVPTLLGDPLLDPQLPEADDELAALDAEPAAASAAAADDEEVDIEVAMLRSAGVRPHHVRAHGTSPLSPH